MEIEKVKNEIKLKKKSKTFRDDKNTFLRKTNEIKRLKYELDLKKNAMEEYKENLKTQINSFNYTISNIKAYKEDIEKNFISKYNDNLRNLTRKIFDLKLFSDKQNNELKNLKKEVANLKPIISKKEGTLKDVEKWLKLQIYIKEGKKPENLKNALKKYQGKLIFDSMEELEGTLSYKQNQNLRLIDKYNKSEKEKDRLIPWLAEQEKSYENFKKTFIVNIEEKLEILNSLKKREQDLIQTINQLKKDDENIELNEIKKVSIEDICNNQMSMNELGIKYKPIKQKNNMYDYINSIFYCLISNDISGISLDTNISSQLNNAILLLLKLVLII